MAENWIWSHSIENKSVKDIQEIDICKPQVSHKNLELPQKYTFPQKKINSKSSMIFKYNI